VKFFDRSNREMVMRAQMKSLGSAAALALMLLSAQAAATYDDKHPEVLDLTAGAKVKPFEQGDPVPVTVLPADATAAIAAAPELRDSGPGLLPLLDPDDKAARKLELANIAAEAGAVKRTGKKLGLKTGAGKTLEFLDWEVPESKRSDGDKDVFVYAGRIGAGKLYRIEERFGHDAPTGIVVNPASGAAASADYGQAMPAVSPDNAHLMAIASNDLMITVAGLGTDGPRLELACRYSDGPELAFKGWHDAGSFDLLLSSATSPADAKPELIAPVRISLQGGAWTIATSNAAALAKWGFGCRQGSARQAGR
jgi:hypothetical protein